MPIAKAERLLDLVIALLTAPRHRSAAWIQRHVAGYGDVANDDAFARMFERDKQELRDLGIPIEIVDDSYLIRPGDFALPAISFSPAESAALAVASRLWDTTALRDVSPAALRKIADATGLDDDIRTTEVADRIQVRVRTAEPAFPALLDALRARRAVRFDYRAAGSPTITTRHLQPWGLANSHGAWYVAGWDLDRDAQRTFRLSRIVSEVTAVGRAGAVTPPPGFDIATAVSAARDETAGQQALVKIRVGTAPGLRRRATAMGSADRGFDEYRLDLVDLADTARRIASYGPDVIVTDPPELRHAVINLLQRSAAQGAA